MSYTADQLFGENSLKLKKSLAHAEQITDPEVIDEIFAKRKELR